MGAPRVIWWGGGQSGFLGKLSNLSSFPIPALPWRPGLGGAEPEGEGEVPEAGTGCRPLPPAWGRLEERLWAESRASNPGLRCLICAMGPPWGPRGACGVAGCGRGSQHTVTVTERGVPRSGTVQGPPTRLGAPGLGGGGREGAWPRLPWILPEPEGLGWSSPWSPSPPPPLPWGPSVGVVGARKDHTVHQAWHGRGRGCQGCPPSGPPGLLGPCLQSAHSCGFAPTKRAVFCARGFACTHRFFPMKTVYREGRGRAGSLRGACNSRSPCCV